MKALKAYMAANNISQSDLARKLGTDKFQVSRWMNGHKAPNISTLRRMSKRLGVPLESLL